MCVISGPFWLFYYNLYEPVHYCILNISTISTNLVTFQTVQTLLEPSDLGLHCLKNNHQWTLNRSIVLKELESTQHEFRKIFRFLPAHTRVKRKAKNPSQNKLIADGSEKYTHSGSRLVLFFKHSTQSIYKIQKWLFIERIN